MMADVMRFFLAIAILILVGLLLMIVAQVSLDQAMRDIAMIVVGAVLAKFNGVYDFYFGSSDGSKVKTGMLAPPKPAENQGDE